MGHDGRRFDERVARLKRTAKEVRRHIIEMIFEAQSGHPGGALSAADIVTALYFDLMRIDPARPRWADRDRFILSKGHACPVWYASLAMRGFFPMEELKTLRKFESILQGHPDMNKTPGVDMTTGSLGQGLSAGVGMALEGKLVGKDYTVYVLLGDGELNEGQVWEAALSAAKFRLDNLVAIVDRNCLQMDGYCEDVMPMDPIDGKFAAFGWATSSIDGHDMAAVVRAIEAARDARGAPTCIVASTTKGKGVSYMEDVRAWHGKVPTREQYETALAEIAAG